MDKLRKYGKNVWLVTEESKKDKQLFTSSSDEILVIENSFSESSPSNISQLEKIFADLQFSENECKSMKEIIESYAKDEWIRANSFGTKMKNVIKTFSYKGKKVKSQTKLFEKLEEKKIIETRKEGSVVYFKIIK